MRKIGFFHAGLFSLFPIPSELHACIRSIEPARVSERLRKAHMDEKVLKLLLGAEKNVLNDSENL